MSPPPSEPHVPYFVPQQRPGSIMFLGITGIVLAAMGVLCTGGLLTLSLVKEDPNMKNMPQWVMVVNLALTVMGILLSFSLLVGSIGLLAMRSWSRPLMLVFAGVDLIFNVGKLIVTLAVLLPIMMEIFQNNPPPGITKETLPWIRTGSIIQSSLIALVTSAYAITVLIVLNRPNVKDALVAPVAPASGPG